MKVKKFLNHANLIMTEVTMTDEESAYINGFVNEDGVPLNVSLFESGEAYSPNGLKAIIDAKSIPETELWKYNVTSLTIRLRAVFEAVAIVKDRLSIKTDEADFEVIPERIEAQENYSEEV